MNEYSHLVKGWYTQKEAWKDLGIGKTKWYEWKKRGIVKTEVPEGEKLQRVSREHLIDLHRTLFKKPSAPLCQPDHLKAKRKKAKTE